MPVGTPSTAAVMPTVAVQPVRRNRKHTAYSKLTLDEKLETTQARADKLTMRLKCCMWSFLVGGVLMILNGLSSFGSARMMSHFIVVSKGQLPWTAKPEDFEEIMRDAETVPPTEADFLLYNSMLVTAALLIVYGLVFLGYAKCAKRASKANNLCQIKFNLCKSVFGFIVFVLAYSGMRHTTHKIMHVAEKLANNETIPAYHYKVPHLPKEHHKHGKGHGHRGDNFSPEDG